MLEAIDLMKDHFTSRPLIERFFYIALVSQRQAEYALIAHQLSTQQIGINYTDHEKIYAAHFILFSTYQHIRLKVPTNELPPVTIPKKLITRNCTGINIAKRFQAVIQAMTLILHCQIFQTCDITLLEDVTKRLGLCNQNLNLLIVNNVCESNKQNV
jgi:hypothetical protein